MDRNPFGGINPHGLYVPLSEDEKEVVQRLTASDDLEIVVDGWGIVNKPKITLGDYRVTATFRLSFDRPEIPVPVHFFDLELRTRSGVSLFKKRQPTVVNGQPILVGSGIFYDLAWDIAIHHMDPNLVRQIKPGAIGYTSRRQDRDTKEFSQTGNMNLSSLQQKLLHVISTGEQTLRQDSINEATTATMEANRLGRG